MICIYFLQYTNIFHCTQLLHTVPNHFSIIITVLLQHTAIFTEVITISLLHVTVSYGTWPFHFPLLRKCFLTQMPCILPLTPLGSNFTIWTHLWMPTVNLEHYGQSSQITHAHTHTTHTRTHTHTHAHTHTGTKNYWITNTLIAWSNLGHGNLPTTVNIM